MRLSMQQMQLLKATPNSAYLVLQPEFLFHSNKMEGSTFSKAELERLVVEGVVTGEHNIDDVLETRNSIDVFDFVVDTLGKPISDEYLCELNRMLFQGTAKEAQGFTGHYKYLANVIGRSSVQLALPSEVKPAMDELRRRWDGHPSSLEEIAAFHCRFEHIHPFQDGNGRIGRFLIMKQCLEADVDLILIDEDFEAPYKAWLEIAQTTGNMTFLYDTFRKCQERFSQKMSESGLDRLIPDSVMAAKMSQATVSHAAPFPTRPPQTHLHVPETAEPLTPEENRERAKRVAEDLGSRPIPPRAPRR